MTPLRIVAFALGAGIAMAAGAQAPAGIQQSFDQARGTLARSLAAHGGAERIGKLASVRLSLKADISSGLQGSDPNVPTQREGDVETRVIMDLAKGRYRTTGVQRTQGGFAFPFNALYKDGNVTFTNPFPPSANRNPVPEPEEGREQTANTGTRLAAPVLLKLATQRLPSLRDEGAGIFEGRAVRRLGFNVDKNTRVSLAIDAETHRLLGFEQLAPDALAGVDTARWVYRGTQTIDGLVVPQGAVVYRRGQPFLDITLTSIAFDEAAKLADAEFDLDAQFAVRDANVPLAITEVKPGLWEVSGAAQGNYRMQFAELADRVIAYDAPVSPSTVKSMVDKFREKVPGKPISHAVLSHFHNDHIGGVRTLAELGATLVVPADAQGFVTRIAHAQARLFGVADTPAPALKFEVPSAALNLGDAKRPLRVLELTGNPHVNRVLVLHDVANRVAIASDMFSDTTPFNQSFDHFATWLAKQPNVELMLGAHHAPATLKQIQDTQAAWRAKQK